MSIRLLKPIDDRIVVWGMSCSGKTTFAKHLSNHHYYCFDAMFQWHLIETFGMSCEANLRHINQSCTADRYVLDGWHLSNSCGDMLPSNASVYLIYASYDDIISQYRVEVVNQWQHLPMFKKWYMGVDYDKLPGIRYFRNTGEFVETKNEEFIELLREHNLGTAKTFDTLGRSSS